MFFFVEKIKVFYYNRSCGMVKSYHKIYYKKNL